MPVHPSPADVDTFEAQLAAAYELILARPPDPDGRATFLPLLRGGELSVHQLCARLVGSEEFAVRLSGVDGDGQASSPDGSPAGAAASTTDGFIDVRQLLASVTVEQLAETADAYFRSALDSPDALLAKPAASIAEAPELLISFGTLLRGLRPLPGATVLDFGAGTCWTSHLLAQLGCHVIAMDISPAALDLGRLLFERSPLFGRTVAPRFQVFDGRRFELEDESVDAIVCFDAFHHVPNPAAVLAEMGRVLRPGGMAAFSESGPHHSTFPQSQYEMRNFGVLENNIVMSEIAEWAGQAGFDDVRLAVFDAEVYWCSLDEFDAVLTGRGRAVGYLHHLRTSLHNRRLFLLKKQGEVESDSRDGPQLRCQLEVTELVVDRDSTPGQLVVSGSCHATNTGPARWLPSDSDIAPVRLGARLQQGGTSRDLARFPVGAGSVGPGESRQIPFHIAVPLDETDPDRPVTVELDLVSEGVTWFAINGCQPIRVWPPES